MPGDAGPPEPSVAPVGRAGGRGRTLPPAPADAGKKFDPRLAPRSVPPAPKMSPQEAEAMTSTMTTAAGRKAFATGIAKGSVTVGAGPPQEIQALRSHTVPPWRQGSASQKAPPPGSATAAAPGSSPAVAAAVISKPIVPPPAKPRPPLTAVPARALDEEGGWVFTPPGTTVSGKRKAPVLIASAEATPWQKRLLAPRVLLPIQGSPFRPQRQSQWCAAEGMSRA